MKSHWHERHDPTGDRNPPVSLLGGTARLVVGRILELLLEEASMVFTMALGIGLLLQANSGIKGSSIQSIISLCSLLQNRCVSCAMNK